jgi:forkhead protein FKH
MKWQIAPEHRQEYLKKQGRKGTQSSVPSSPAAKEVPSSSRNANGRTTMGYEGAFPASAEKTSPHAPSPGFGGLSVAPVEAYTPERGSRAGRAGHGLPRGNTDYEGASPLPSRPRMGRVYGLSDNVAGSPPTLSSSYYDDGLSMITPAPQRQQPRLPPPSTAQVPSKFMPMSSPAQFWKFADIGSTPARPVPDMSPLKSNIEADGDGLIPSSSPPPPNLGSPSNLSRPGGRMLRPIRREDDGVDRSNANGVEKPPASGLGDDDEDDDDGRFDLARFVSHHLCPELFLF